MSDETKTSIGFLFLILIFLLFATIIIYNGYYIEDSVVEETTVEETTPQPQPRKWSPYMIEWLQAGNGLVIDFLNVKEKEWCAVAIQRPVDSAHPSTEQVIECIQ